MMSLFADRADAGGRLGSRLSRFRDSDAVVLGVPLGGVPVAFEVARALRVALDVIVVRKLDVGSHPELGMGAVGEDDVRIINDEVLWRTGVSADEISRAVGAARAEVDRLAARLRAGRPRARVRGRSAIVVDDGIATGSTAHTACRTAHELGATEVVLAVPFAPPHALERLEEVTDEQVCLASTSEPGSFRQSYLFFPAVTEAEVADLLRRSTSG
ncbi:phosphoribosyltransferase [Saccharopolyspora taberi]|uniref:Phosphoribosyltransferase domain-containing protein n=1 Tax=Saccharopolyspora taberi TaxID=60895 RepID=A0ABN3VHR5_9PSEU